MRSFAERIKCTQDPKFAEAMRAFSRGQASEHQQKLAFTWLIEVACRVTETSHVLGDSHASAFLEGRRSIAVDVVALMKSKQAKEAKDG